MPDRMLCAVLEQFQLYFSRWYVRFVSVSVGIRVNDRSLGERPFLHALGDRSGGMGVCLDG